MMKRSIRYAIQSGLVIALIAALFGVRTVEPASAASAIPLASLLPDDTLLYGELPISSLQTLLGGQASALGQSLTGGGTRVDLPQALDKMITELFGRPATFSADVLPWIGDTVGIGVRFPGDSLDVAILSALRGVRGPEPEGMFLASVKDDSAADKALQEMIASIEKRGAKFETTQDQFGNVLGTNVTATIYTSQRSQLTIARWSGFLAIGLPSLGMLTDVVKNGRSPLAADETFRNTIRLLRPESLGMVYTKAVLPGRVMPYAPVLGVVGLSLLGPAIGSVFSTIISQLTTPGPTATPTPSPTPTATPAPTGREKDILKALENMGGMAFSVVSKDKYLALDIAVSNNADSIKRLNSLLNIPPNYQLPAASQAMTLRSPKQLPANSLVAIMGTEFPKMYSTMRWILVMYVKAITALRGEPDVSDQIVQGEQMLFSQLKSITNIDVTADVFSWMTGEYALFTRYNPAGILGQAARLPIEQSLLVQATDTSKTQSFANRLVAALKSVRGLTVTTEQDASSIRMGPLAIASFGLINDSFLLSSASGYATAVAAIRGDGVLEKDPAWQAAAATFPQAVQDIWYFNVDGIAGALQQEARKANRTEPGLKTLEAYQSFFIVGTQLNDTDSVTTFAVLTK